MLRQLFPFLADTTTKLRPERLLYLKKRLENEWNDLANGDGSALARRARRVQFIDALRTRLW